MKLKSFEECTLIPKENPASGAELLGILHPLYDELPIGFCMAKLRIEPGAVSKIRRLGVANICYVIAGSGTVNIEGQNTSLKPGSALYIPAHSVRYFSNTGEEKLKILSVLNEAWRDEFEEAV